MVDSAKSPWDPEKEMAMEVYRVRGRVKADTESLVLTSESGPTFSVGFESGSDSAALFRDDELVSVLRPCRRGRWRLYQDGVLRAEITPEPSRIPPTGRYFLPVTQKGQSRLADDENVTVYRVDPPDGDPVLRIRISGGYWEAILEDANGQIFGRYRHLPDGYRIEVSPDRDRFLILGIGTIILAETRRKALLEAKSDEPNHGPGATINVIGVGKREKEWAPVIVPGIPGYPWDCPHRRRRSRRHGPV